MYKTYGNIMRLRQILTVLAKRGFSHFLARMRIHDYAPWIGRLMDPVKDRGDPVGRDLPNQLAQAFQELGPAFIKLGQLLATRPDIVSEDFQQAFARLQDKVEPLPPETIVPALEASLGRPLDGVFRKFDRNAVASGSIGQAHNATLPGGEDVVVKVQRPGIGKVIQDDLALLEWFAELIEDHIPELSVVRPVSIIQEFRRAMENELDFVGEASYTSKFREMLKDDAGIAVPKVYWEYVSHSVLVLERLRGTPLTRAGDLSAEHRGRIAAVLADCFMRQCFLEGFFHADPHPGNIFIMPDGGVGLLDFGQVGRLSEEQRHVLGFMLVALVRGETDAMADLYAEIGEFSPDANAANFRQDLAGLVDRYFGMPADRIDFASLIQELLAVARRNGLHLPRSFVMLSKSLVTIAGVLRELYPDFRLDAAVKPFARKLVLGMANPAAAAKRGWNTASRILGLLRRMPDDAKDLVEKAKAGKFTIVFHHENLHDVVERISRSFDRFAFGVIAAAVIIGCSIILVSGQNAMPASDLPIVGRVPLSVVVAFVGFFGSILVVLYMAWGIFRDKS
jgi:ubiquinone biosynthesis protein